MLLMNTITLFSLLFASQICSNKRNSGSLQKSPCNLRTPRIYLVAFTTLITKKERIQFNTEKCCDFLKTTGSHDEIMLRTQDLKFDSHLW